jgi:hypothetical protein
MALHVDRRQRAYEAKAHAVLDTYRAYGRLTPAVLANREFVAARLAEGEQRRHLGVAQTGPGPIRCWLGRQIISLGNRLAGVQTGIETGLTSTEDAIPVRANP